MVYIREENELIWGMLYEKAGWGLASGRNLLWNY